MVLRSCRVRWGSIRHLPTLPILLPAVSTGQALELCAARDRIQPPWDPFGANPPRAQ
jgi:hypothetical protein